VSTLDTNWGRQRWSPAGLVSCWLGHARGWRLCTVTLTRRRRAWSKEDVATRKRPVQIEGSREGLGKLEDVAKGKRPVQIEGSREGLEIWDVACFTRIVLFFRLWRNAACLWIGCWKDCRDGYLPTLFLSAYARFSSWLASPWGG